MKLVGIWHDVNSEKNVVEHFGWIKDVIFFNTCNRYSWINSFILANFCQYKKARWYVIGKMEDFFIINFMQLFFSDRYVYFFNHKKSDRKKSETARENSGTQSSCKFFKLIKMFHSLSSSWWIICRIFQFNSLEHRNVNLQSRDMWITQ